MKNQKVHAYMCAKYNVCAGFIRIRSRERRRGLGIGSFMGFQGLGFPQVAPGKFADWLNPSGDSKDDGGHVSVSIF